MVDPDDIDTDEPDAQDSEHLRDVWECALTELDAVAVPQIEMRGTSLEDRRFPTIPGAMWEGPWGIQNENAPRPEVDKITKGLEKIETDWRENRLDVDYVPADSVADQETADTLDGMYRADANFYKASQAHDNALQEAIRGGFGAWRLATEYADPLDPDDDSQRINPGLAIVDADQSVYFFGGILYDKSDADSCFVLTRDLRKIAENKWGEENCVEWPQDNWKFTWDWYTPEVVCIAEYYKTEIKREQRLTFTNTLTKDVQRYWASEIDTSARADLQAQGWTLSTRTVKRKRVHKYILNGTRVLKDCGYISGDMIPVVPVYGRRDWVDNMERWRGYVGKKKDRQRIYNSAIAKVVETQSIAPYEVPIVYAEQIDGVIPDGDGGTISIAEHWARGNIERKPFRVIMPMYNPDGALAINGPIGKIEPPQVQPATAALLQISSADLTDDDQSVEEVKSNVSADAMDIARSQIDLKSAIYLDNMRQSMQRAAEIYLAMARAVYFEPGRKVDTVSIDGQDGQATLAEPVRDDQGIYKVRNELTQGKYKVVASVQESTTTKREKTVRQCLGIVEALSPLQNMQDIAGAAALTAIMNMNGEGISGLQDVARKKGIEIGLVTPTPEEEKQIEQDAQKAQGQQQTDPATMALGAQAAKLQSEAELNKAKGTQVLADAHLKLAQANAVGGPDAVPDTPTGLDHADTISKIASADLDLAKAAHLRHGMSISAMKAHADATKTAHDMHIAERAQTQAEKEPKAA